MAKEAPACAGPDRALRKPRFTPPPGSWDCQAHIFGPTDRYPLSPDRSYTPEDCPLEQYLELLDTLGFDRGVLVQGGAHGTDNSAMLDGLRRQPERLRGVAVFRPGLPEAELLEMHALGVRGVRMTTMVGGGVTFEQMEGLAAQTGPLGWFLQLHFLHSSELLDLEARLKRLPNRFLLDHLARITAAEGVDSAPFKAVRRLLETGRCWVRLSSLYRLSSEPYPHRDMLPMIETVVRERPDRILWGSNWPHPVHVGPMPNDADLVDLIPLWTPDPEDRRRMLATNPLELFS